MSVIQNARVYMKWINETIRLDAIASTAKSRKVYRGQVYWCYFGVNIGSEQNEKRPCVILQNNIGNLSSPNTIVAPITHTNTKLPTVIPIDAKYNALGKLLLDGNVLLSHIKTVCKSRLDGYITDLTADEMKLVNEAVAKSIDLHTIFVKQEKQLSGQQAHIDNLTETIRLKDTEIAKLNEEISRLKNS